MIIPSIYDYVDFIDFLNDFMEKNQKESKHFSKNALSVKLDWPPSYLTDLIKERRTLTIRRAIEFGQLLKFDTQDSERLIFLALKSSSEKGLKEYFHSQLTPPEFTNDEKSAKVKEKYRDDSKEAHEQYDLAMLFTIVALRARNGIMSGKELKETLWTFSDISKEKYDEYVKSLEKNGAFTTQSDGTLLFHDDYLFFQSDQGDLDQHFIDYLNNTITYIAEIKDKHTFSHYLGYNLLILPKAKIKEITNKLEHTMLWISKLSHEAVALNRPLDDDHGLFQLNMNLFPVNKIDPIE